MKTRFALKLMIVFVMLMLGSGWTNAQNPPKKLDIGIATPLTGPAAHLGINIKNAALMAIDDQNAQGGVKIAGETYVLNPIVLDTKKDPAVEDCDRAFH
jgi:ABC-type branched-subunit amino acid transport system substrate-binding protein